jgi:hypothetical protein
MRRTNQSAADPTDPKKKRETAGSGKLFMGCGSALSWALLEEAPERQDEGRDKEHKQRLAPIVMTGLSLQIPEDVEECPRACDETDGNGAIALDLVLQCFLVCHQEFPSSTNVSLRYEERRV